MTWFDWILIALWVVSIVLTPVIVGRPRKPLTSMEAAIQSGIYLLLIVGLLATRGVLS